MNEKEIVLARLSVHVEVEFVPDWPGGGWRATEVETRATCICPMPTREIAVRECLHVHQLLVNRVVIETPAERMKARLRG